MDVRTAIAEYKHAKLRLSKQTLRGYMHRLGVFASWREREGLSLESMRERHVRLYSPCYLKSSSDKEVG
jgi:hypothetical protein